MKALTIWQPWATLIVAGAKPYEFRGWRPPRSLIGQRIAIHAGARPVRTREVLALVQALKGGHDRANPCLHREIALPLLDRALAGLCQSPGFWHAEPVTLPLSHVLCTAVLGEPKRGDECAAEFGIDAGNDSDREGTFNWGWPLTDIEPLLPPESARGAQGLWEWKP